MNKETVTLDLITYDRLKEKARDVEYKLKAKEEEFSKREKELLDIIEGLKSGAKCIKIDPEPVHNTFGGPTYNVKTHFINCENLEKQLRLKIEAEICEKVRKDILENDIHKNPEYIKLSERLIDSYKEKADLIIKINNHNSKWYNFNKIK